MHGLCENMPVSLGSGGIRGVFDLIALLGAAMVVWHMVARCRAFAVDCRCRLCSAAYVARPLSD